MEGKLIIVSAPSGSGKTTIVRELLKLNPKLEFSVSACSRPKREHEVHGKDYYFISEEEFRSKINKDSFVEWEEVYPGSFYGTLKSELHRIWGKGNHVVFDVDVIGGLNIKKQFGSQALSVFIMPPSIEELENRLRARKTETEESLKKRINKAEYEMTFSKDFDTIVINDVLEDAINKAEKLINNFISES